jgi:hypothetical protein
MYSTSVDIKEAEKIEIVKKFDDNLKKFVFHCKYKSKKFKFIDGESEKSFKIAQKVAFGLLKFI